ncbi:MAG: hypothetical protein K2L07_16850 [Lachnospiraceae bacterium]|nr:hypothetical protein [Lachnospiraceae bacterium]
MSMSLIDYDELECKFCGHIGLLPNGDYNVECPVCDAEYSLIEDDEGDDEEDDD